MMRWLLFLLWMGIQLGQGFDGVADFFIETLVNHTTPFVGEQITYTVRYYAFSQEGIRVQYPDFEGFWIGESYESYRGLQVINDKQFFVREVQIHLAPLITGEIIIQPAQLLVTGDVFRSEQIIPTSPITLNIRSLPEGAPSSFSGAVGDFVMNADFETGILILGNPFVFSITIQGVGILDTLTPPNLNLPLNWRILPQSPMYMRGNENIGVALGSKEFQWVIIPNEAGSHRIAPIEWTYFDPRTQTYITLTIPAFTLDVLPSSDGEIRLSSAYTTSFEILPLKTPKTNYPFYDVLTGFPWGFLGFIMPVLFFITIQYTRYQRRKIRQTAHKRYQTAFSRAKKRLNQLRKQPNPTRMSNVIIAYIADKANVANSDVIGDMYAYIPQADLQIMIENLMTMIKSVSYIPQNSDYDALALIDEVEIALSQVEKIWRAVQ
ncbi:MAG: BatD family protein [Anaerolineae bacterium]|jgi:hypothetical protein|nr:BatD family protein [Anaerolineae bacterium]